LERDAFHLSKPNARKVTTLKAVNQTAANESILLKRKVILPFFAKLGTSKRRHGGGWLSF
jgi:hypothetical protein